VADLATALAFYERLLDRAPDMRPNEREACWQLGDEAWLYVIVDPARAGGAVNTVLVDDLDARLAAWAQRGIVPAEVEEYASGTRKAVLLDPDGNELGFGQVG
jgi:predicted enzyme related to lactoylglutathione lyase